MVLDETVRSCDCGPIKKMDGSTGVLDLDFNFMFRVIEFKSGDKDHDFDGTLFQSDSY